MSALRTRESESPESDGGGVVSSIFRPNDCGKSTLINMIAGLSPLDAGEILFDGRLNLLFLFDQRHFAHWSGK